MLKLLPDSTKHSTSHCSDDSKFSSGASEFNYSSLPPSVQKFLRGQASRIRQYATKSIIQIGKDLIGAKHYLAHGAFLRWVEDEVGMPARTAQAYMRVAAWASSNSMAAALLPPTALHVLSSPGVPPELVTDILNKVEAGEHISLPALRAQIKALRKPNVSQKPSIDEVNKNSRSLHVTPNSTATTDKILTVVQILARALPAADFALVRDIITTKSVLEDPNLPEILAWAFVSEAVASASNEPRYTREPTAT
ncbi:MULTISPECIES: DUF3102 domain-containing protein [unclassified Bradyrhizobium]|uniref:DUF3102 domain-containing protein n=1 Tax=unclassified Bradyrhizobium TaxID=2631580 RepID=UPI0029160D75|nr:MULTISPECIES: DUF3102 domain-containing protein [unclassified Bradyrhizobium]